MPTPSQSISEAKELERLAYPLLLPLLEMIPYKLLRDSLFSHGTIHDVADLYLLMVPQGQIFDFEILNGED